METLKVLIIFSLEILLTEDLIHLRLSVYCFLLKSDTQNRYISLEATMRINGLTMGSDSVMSVTLDLVKIQMKMIPFLVGLTDYLSGYLLQLLLKIKLFVCMVESVHPCITFQKSRTSSDL